MANLNASLTTLSNTLRAFERSMDTAQNNVANASTPGYAKLTTRMDALLFDAKRGLSGGVENNGVQSARDRFAEIAVQRQISNLGQFKESATLLSSLNQILDISSSSSIPAGLNRLLQSFSAWSVAPQSVAARQDVVQQAEQFAGSLQVAARQVEDLAKESELRLTDATTQINSLGQQLAAINRQRNQTSAADPSLESVLHNTLDELAKLVNFTTITGDDGNVSVLIGGQTALTIGENSFELRGMLAPRPEGQSSGGVREWQFLDASGQNVAASISSGSVKGMLEMRNRTLPSLIGGQGQTGRLNDFASGLAARINGLLTGGQVSQSTSTPGLPLFAFASSDPTQAASSFQLNQTVSANDLATGLAAAQSGPPFVANGVALDLAGLLQTNEPQNLIDGSDFLTFFGRSASQIGFGLQTASTWKERSESLLAQAKAMRHEISGVSLDEEAARIIELQRGHQAVSRLIAMLDKMADSVMSMLR